MSMLRNGALICSLFFTHTHFSITIFAEISCGELVDKITILEIKMARITDPQKLSNIQKELIILITCLEKNVPCSSELLRLKDELFCTNELLWDIEDTLREKEHSTCFDAEFIELARGVYCTNDKRYLLKQKINLLLDSSIIEEKSHTDYTHVIT
ncbi:MAG TPA: DUF6165 family protein [Candidatus Bathyarchaeia archaeon]|nr:DUF6165 family protein [Candidatus Bathyarchaeia archaeon]